jgi:hypothetical protein
MVSALACPLEFHDEKGLAEKKNTSEQPNKDKTHVGRNNWGAERGKTALVLLVPAMMGW